MGQALAEPGFGFKQIPGQPKNTGVGTGMAYGDAVAYVIADNQWKKAVAASVKPFGFCGDLEILTQSTNNLTGVVTATRGATDAQTNFSVIVAGRIRRVADGAIPAGEFVMLSATAPLTEVKVWDGVAPAAIVGRYVINITQHHDANVVPDAADNDEIKIDVTEDEV